MRVFSKQVFLRKGAIILCAAKIEILSEVISA
jgi:hypothetical protein